MRTTALPLVAAFAAVLATASARAHQLVCEKTVDGQATVDVSQYPVTLSYVVEVTNVHPTDVSVLLSATDTLHPLDFVLPLSLAVGASAMSSYSITLRSFEECAELAGVPQSTTSVTLTNHVDIGWDSGSAQCSAEVVCRPPPPPPPSAATRTMGFFKTHEQALSACLAQGPLDLGFLGICTPSDALGLLWGSPSAFSDGSVRAGLDKLRFLLGRQTLVAICNVRLFGADGAGLIAQAVSALGGTSCTLLSSLISLVDAFNSSNETVPFPAGFVPGAATPQHAQSIATDPTSPSGQSCQ
jgi:hypothetical protein